MISRFQKPVSFDKCVGDATHVQLQKTHCYFRFILFYMLSFFTVVQHFWRRFFLFPFSKKSSLQSRTHETIVQRKSHRSVNHCPKDFQNVIKETPMLEFLISTGAEEAVLRCPRVLGKIHNSQYHNSQKKTSTHSYLV